MSLEVNQDTHMESNGVRLERTYQRFTLGQRWEHVLLFLSVSVLLLTGLPQKYRAATWAQQILTTPERLDLIRQIHHIAAIVLIIEVIYHLFHNLYLLFGRRLPEDIFPTWQDLRSAWQMLKYLLFLTKEKPVFGKYNFEQKFTYWFIFLILSMMGMTGLIIWFPLEVTNFLPGGIVPAAKLTHSTEAIVTAIFIIIWHFFHVHIERLNLSIFTGRLSEEEMRKNHAADYKRFNGVVPDTTKEESGRDAS
jgi:formate dehydrogenase gamma subunit